MFWAADIGPATRTCPCEVTLPPRPYTRHSQSSAFSVAACIGLNVTSISVPGMLERGGVAYLRCNFEADDEENAGAINVTWYKDGHKFFHAVTKGLKANNTAFDVPGVEVDVSTYCSCDGFLLFS